MSVQGPNGFHDFFKNFRTGNQNTEKQDDAVLDYVGDVKYAITKQELDYIHENSGLNSNQLAEFDKALEAGKVGEFIQKLDSAGINNTLGLSLSSTIGKTDATKDVEEARRLAELVDTDCDMKSVLQYIENAGASSVVRVQETAINTFTKLNDIDALGPNNLVADREERIGTSFLEFIGYLGENPML